MPEPTAAQRSAYARGMVFVISMTNDPATNAYLQQNPNSVFRSIILENQGAGVIAQPATPMVNGQLGAAPPVVFIPFPFTSQSVAVGTVPPQRWATLQRTTPLVDLGNGSTATLVDYYAEFFTEIEAQPTPQAPRSFGGRPAGAQPGAPAGQPAAQAPGAPAQGQPYNGELPPFDKAFTQGLIFRLDFTSNPDLQQFQGMTMQVAKVNGNALVAIPEASTNLREGVIIFNDKKQRYTFKPAGNHRFASGLQSGQRLWNPQQRNYVVVDTWYPSYFGSPFIGVPYVLCDMAIPVGFAVGMALGCMIDLLTCPFGYNYYCDGYYPGGMYGGRYYGGGWGLGYYGYGYDFWGMPYYDPGFGYYGCGFYGDCFAGYYGYDPVFGAYGGYGGFWGYDAIYPGYDTYGVGYGVDGAVIIEGGADFGYGDTTMIDNGYGDGATIIDNGGVVDGQGYNQDGFQVDPNGDANYADGQVDQGQYDQGQVDPAGDANYADGQADQGQYDQGQVDPGGDAGYAGNDTFDAPDIGGGDGLFGDS